MGDDTVSQRTTNVTAREGPMNWIGLAMLCLVMLLGGCVGSFHGDANAGPNPGGGFYGAPNLNVGRINP